MFEVQRNEENPAGASAKVPLAWAVLSVWREGQLAADEALRALHVILEGAYLTPSGARLRSACAPYDTELRPASQMSGDGPITLGTTQSWPATISGSSG